MFEAFFMFVTKSIRSHFVYFGKSSIVQKIEVLDHQLSRKGICQHFVKLKIPLVFKYTQ